MAFLHSVMGDNTPENREHLKKLGYKKHFVVSFVDFELIYTWKGEFYFIDKYDLKGIEMSLFINCIGNPELFRAVTAMRDDNHIHQWHIIDYDVYLDMPKDYWFIATDLSGCKHVGCQIDPMYCHKATLSELQEHFKRV